MVHLELRYRYFSLTGKRLEEFEHQLNDDQLFALRFASDDEFPPLTHRALNENLSGKEIKKAIQHWKSDHERV
jgi:phosphoserine phosphatase